MTTTLSRRIRRIGLLPTTYKEVKEETLGHDSTGAEAVIVKVKKVPVRHHSRMAADVREELAQKLRAEVGAARRAARATKAVKP